MNHVQESVVVLKVLCNTHRYAIMQLLLTTKKDMCVNEIADTVGISQSLASHQLAYLQARGLVEGHRMGQTICYLASDIPLNKKIHNVIHALS